MSAALQVRAHKATWIPSFAVWTAGLAAGTAHSKRLSWLRGRRCGPTVSLSAVHSNA